MGRYEKPLPEQGLQNDEGEIRKDTYPGVYTQWYH